MEVNDRNNEKKIRKIFSQSIRAGKRTYFFDVKETRDGEYYLTITESKRRFNKEQEKIFFEKHKLFLYKQDFEKFSNGLKTAIDFIETGETPEDYDAPQYDEENSSRDHLSVHQHSNIDFEDLDHQETDKKENDADAEEGLKE